jgi:hypothetical protein
VDLFRFVPGYTDVVYHEGKEPLFLLFLAFVVAFALTRGYTRIARKRGWGSGSVGGVHLHHIVPGLILVLLAGLVAYTRVGATEIPRELCAIGFGAGAALVLDEFALVFYLRDVYWAKEGRASIDATIFGLMLAALFLVVSEPFSFDQPERKLGRLVFFAVVTANIAFAAISFLKGKRYSGTAAVLLPVVGWVAAVRLATPRSPWARWFYSGSKLTAAQSRAEVGLGARFERWLVTVVGGEPTLR